MNTWDQPASEETLTKTISALAANGITSYTVKNEDEARMKVLELIPKGKGIMEMTSVTLDAIGLNKALKGSGHALIKERMVEIDREKYRREMRMSGAAPEVAVGSVHAVTEDGKVLIVSNTGSQLPAYAYGADKVIWVVGTQKIVKDVDEGLKRIYEYTLPLESERAKKAYSAPGSFVSKTLIVNREYQKDRVFIVFIEKNLGF